jgi:hypothetical protein
MTRKHKVSETGCFPSSGKGRQTHTLLRPLETANLRQKEIQFPERCFFYLFRIPDDGQLQTPRDYTNITKVSLVYGFVWAWNLVSDIKGETQTGCIREQGADENIWTEETLSDGRLEKTV